MDVYTMIDGKALSGTIATMVSASASWLEIAEPVVTIFVTLVVGGLTAWYTWERATKLRHERKGRKK